MLAARKPAVMPEPRVRAAAHWLATHVSPISPIPSPCCREVYRLCIGQSLCTVPVNNEVFYNPCALRPARCLPPMCPP